MASPTLLSKQHILAVEDDYFIADDLKAMLEAAGAEVVGPAASLAATQVLLDRTEQLDGAILDINLRGDLVFPLADALQGPAIPFIFATGYRRSAIPARFSHVRACEKPLDVEQIASAMRG